MSARDVLAGAPPFTRNVHIHRQKTDLEFPPDYALADAILSALSAAGYVVVPREPTFEQQDRALHDMGTPNPKMSRQQLRDFYRAMLAAAQEAPDGP